MSARGDRGIGLRRKLAADAADLNAPQLAERISRKLGRPVPIPRVRDWWQGRRMEEEILVAYAEVVHTTPEALQIPVPESEWGPYKTVDGRRFRSNYPRVGPGSPLGSAPPPVTRPTPAMGPAMGEAPSLSREQQQQVVGYLQALRQVRGLTLPEVAAVTGMNYRTIGLWLHGNPLPPLNRLDDLARAIGTTLEEVLRELAARQGPTSEPEPEPRAAAAGTGATAPEAPITALDLSAGTRYLLGKSEVVTVGELADCTVQDLVEAVQLSAQQLAEVEAKLAAAGYQLATPLPDEPPEPAPEALEKEATPPIPDPEVVVVPLPEAIPEAIPEELSEIPEEIPELHVPDLRPLPLEPVPGNPEELFAGPLYQEAEELVLLLEESVAAGPAPPDARAEIVQQGESLLKWLAFSGNTRSPESMMVALTRAHEAVITLAVQLRLMQRRGQLPVHLGARLMRELLALTMRVKDLELDRAEALEEARQ